MIDHEGREWSRGFVRCAMSLRGASELSRISFLVAACSATLAKLRATALCFIAVRGLWFDGSMFDAI